MTIIQSMIRKIVYNEIFGTFMSGFVTSKIRRET